MSIRLQVLMPDSELKEIRRTARRRKMSVAEWVRQTLREARRSDPSGDAEKKLAAIRSASRNEFPTTDIDQMLREIESGYGEGPKAPR
ncbi:MAG TPA: antitoxin [Thermoanaerobaculia bacterium]|jgi:hypothetical protein